MLKNAFSPIDGRKHKTEIGEVQAKWKDDSLVIKTKPERGGKVKRTLTLSESGQQLTVKLKFEGGGSRPTIELNRVYDLDPPPQELASP